MPRLIHLSDLHFGAHDPKLVDAVTREQVLAAARHVFDLRRSVTGYLLPKDQS